MAVASRSIAAADLHDALLRLTDVARRRVCITLATGSSPRIDERVLDAIGLPTVLGRDYLYAFNILADGGIKAEVRYIDSTRAIPSTRPTTPARSWAHGRRLRGRARAERDAAQARAPLRERLAANLVPNERAGLPTARACSNSPGAFASLAPSPGHFSPGIPTSSKKGPGLLPGPWRHVSF